VCNRLTHVWWLRKAYGHPGKTHDARIQDDLRSPSAKETRLSVARNRQGASSRSVGRAPRCQPASPRPDPAWSAYAKRADPKGCAWPCSPTGPPALEVAGGAGDLARRPAPRPGWVEGEPLSAITAGCGSLAAMVAPRRGPAPGNRMPGRLPSLLPGVCSPAGQRRAAAGIRWPRLRRASHDQDAWRRATRR
jgi:hypothetical protein